MGVSIDLYVLAGGVDPAEWGRAYDDVLRLWSTHPSGARGIGWRVACGVEVPAFVRSLEREERGGRQISIAGDVRSMRFAEPCALPGWEALAARAASRRRAGGGASSGGVPFAGGAVPRGVPLAGGAAPRDVLFAGGAAPRDVLFAGEAARLHFFGGDTRGEPYYDLVLAAGMLVEARLPGRAFVTGEVDRARAERARSEIASCLGVEVGLPVVVDAAALARRLAARRAGAALVASFRRRFAGDAAEGLGHVLRALDDEAARGWLRSAWRGGVRALERRGLSSRAVLAGWLRSGREVEPFVRAGVGADIEPGALADEIARSGCLLPPVLAAKARAAFDGRWGERPGAGRLAVRMARFALERLELEARLDEGALGAALEAAVPGRGRPLLARARAEAARLAGEVEDALAVLDGVRREAASCEPRQDEGELSRVASLDEVAPGPRAAIARLVDAVYDAWNGPAAGGDVVPDTAEGLKRLFAAAVARGRPVLTEDAWGAILAERDLAVLRWLARLAACEGPGDEAARLKRALIEGAALRREGARLYAERAAEPARRLAERGR